MTLGRSNISWWTGTAPTAGSLRRALGSRALDRLRRSDVRCHTSFDRQFLPYSAYRRPM